MRTKSVSLLVGCLSLVLLGPQSPPISSGGQDKETLVRYLRDHWQSPEVYVISKFMDHDIVFIGEMHRVQHDAELIHHLIPLLYRAGIFNLGIEFGGIEYQGSVDSLTTAANYDEALARRVMFQWSSSWGYNEYMDIYRSAWKLNTSLPAGARRFRVVHLNYIPRWDLMSEGNDETQTREAMKKVWYRGDGDAFMADVVIREFVSKGEKALIYSGQHHAFVRYRQPAYDFSKKQLVRLINSRMGNLVYEKIAGKAFNICLHYPWPAKESFDSNIYPTEGAVDKVMIEFKDKRVGFDVVNSPFGALKDSVSYYSLGHDSFCLGDFCDGYIYQMPPKQYVGCTVDTLFITEANLREAVHRIPNVKARAYFTNPGQFVEDMRRDADWQRRLQDLR